MTRDAVRMMVARRASAELTHSTFALLPHFLDPGDLVVINTSGTIPAAIEGRATNGARVAVHLSTHLAGDRWVVEPRVPVGDHSARWTGGLPPTDIALGDGAAVHLLEPLSGSDRLWEAELAVPGGVLTWLAVHGRPIRYSYVERSWPITAYQNVYATVPGSAEMPSAGRPFTPEVITRLVAKGVGIAPVVLHTGVASLEAHELPYPERVVVPADTVAKVMSTRDNGGRVIAIGTTVVRALETAGEAGTGGEMSAVDGWTDLVITPERGVKVVDGMLTGWHEPEASHLMMLEAIAGRELLERSYEASLAERYLWHEFGDVHLILP